METSKEQGVLVILTGGNICLVTQVHRETQILKSADEATIRALVVGDSKEEVLALHENEAKGRRVLLRFCDVRKREAEMGDPEEADSAQIRPDLWSELATIIHSRYMEFEGFVILHGLDTMAYTAAALSFMLADLAKPVVLTGSQRPLNYRRTDAIQNVVSAVTFAGAASLGLEPRIPEVTVYSHDTLFRGNRVSMVSAASYRSFDSSNYSALATVGAHIEINGHLVHKTDATKRPNLRKGISAKVQILDVFPGMESSVIQGIYKLNERLEAGDETTGTSERIAGVVLRTYGMGTTPTRPEFLSALDRLVSSGVVVCSVTQARSGRISHGLDPISLRLFEHGVVSGVDMTAESAYAKLVILLSSSDVDSEVAADMFQIEQCGEQSQSIFTLHYGPGQTFEAKGGRVWALLEPLHDMTEQHLLSQTRVRFVQLRVLGVTPVPAPSKAENRTVEFDAYLVDREQQEAHVTALKTDHQLRWSAQGRLTINAAFDITSSYAQIMSKGTMIKIDTYQPISWKRLSVVVHADTGT